MWQDVAEASHVAVDTALQSLPGFPAAHQLPKPIRLDKTGGFVYEDNVWLLAVSKTQQPDVGNRKRPWPGKSTADRTMFCQSWKLRLSTLSRAADDYLLREHRLRAFAADAGAGGDCFFLSVAAALETLRAEQHNLPLSLEQLFSEDVSRGAMVRRLRGIVGQGVMNWSPKQFLDFATTCLANEVAGMWLDSWKMSRLIANTPFAFLQSVNSVHDLTLDAANTLILHCKHGESPNLVQHRIDSGRDVLTKTRELWLTTSARSATTTGQRILTWTFCPRNYMCVFASLETNQFKSSSRDHTVLRVFCILMQPPWMERKPAYACTTSLINIFSLFSWILKVDFKALFDCRNCRCLWRKQ